MERVENLIRLSLAPELGSVSIHRLLRHFGSGDRVLGAGEAALRQVEGIGEPQRQGVRKAAAIDPRPEMDLAAEKGIHLLAFDDPAYPAQLRLCDDPPHLLYVRGELKPADNIALAIVGTRRASRYGREQAERFGSLLARAGFAVVSGLALGIDTCAHRGCLDAGGRTLAVLGCGFCHLYPESNRDLAAEIARQGAILSEFPMEVTPDRTTFPRRNRIIAGLSLGTLVVEAPVRSGALITARYANDMNREVFAVPGRVDQDNAAGCHELIRHGATLTRDLDDILQELGPLADDVQRLLETPASPAQAELPLATPPPPEATGGKEQKILDALAETPIHIDEICAATGLPVSEVSAALMILEIRRAVVQRPGKLFLRART